MFDCRNLSSGPNHALSRVGPGDSVGGELKRPRAAAGCVSVTGLRGHARDIPEHAFNLHLRCRERSQLGSGHEVTGRGRFGFEQLGPGRYLHRFHYVAEFQGHVQTQGFCRADRDVLSRQLLEPGCFIRDLVRSDTQVRNAVNPFLGRAGVVGETGVLVPYDH